MRLNHIILGAHSVSESRDFYVELLGFKEGASFVDTGTGQTGLVLEKVDLGRELQLLIVPFAANRLPNPQHLAFEVNELEFEGIFEAALIKKLKVRAEPALTSTKAGIGTLQTSLINYRIFYLLDPAGINVEIMHNVGEK